MPVYDKKTLFQSLAILVGTMLLMKITGGWGFLFVALFVFGALMMRRADKLFFYILLVISMLLANSNFAPKDFVFGLVQRGLMLIVGIVMLFQLAGSPISRYAKPLLGILPYVFFMVVPSIQGWNPKISFLKMFLFVVIYMAYFGVANSAAQRPVALGRVIRAELLAVAIFFIVGSVALIPFPGLSQMHADCFLDNPNATSLFMGMTNQSQSLGPVISSLGVILFGDLLFSVKRPNKLYLFLLICSPVLIYKTSSRTGMGSYLLGMGYIVWLFMRARGINLRWRGRVMNWVLLLLAVAILASFILPGVRQSAVNFALKWSDEGGNKELTTENILSTRQGKIDECLENFRQKPLIGNGFQVSNDMAYMRQSGLMLSAPIEKGVWIYAVLEEGGVIGVVLFAGFLVIAILTLAKRGCYIASACMFVCSLTNLGEFTFFSMTYTGGFVWAMVFAGLAMDVQRIKAEQQFRVQRPAFRV